jgi:predicted O-methyltransferase YrrM
MTFVEEWYSTRALNALRDAALDARSVEGMAVEVGSWEGRSALQLAPIFAPRVLICVDHWQGTPRSEAAFEAFRRNTVHVENLITCRQDWRHWTQTAVGQCAFVHLDADHSYETVRDQIAAFLPRMAPGGVLCGHDYEPGEWDGVVEAVDEFLPHREVDSAVWRVTC